MPIAVLWFLGLTTRTTAVCSQPHPTICAEFSHSDAVFTGTVLSETVVVDADGYTTGWYYKMRVLKAIRGVDGVVRQTERVMHDAAIANFSRIDGRTFLGTKGPEVTIVARGGTKTYRATAGTDGWFHLIVEPGTYGIHAYLAGREVPPYDLSYDDPKRVRVQKGQCALVQFVAE